MRTTTLCARVEARQPKTENSCKETKHNIRVRLLFEIQRWLQQVEMGSRQIVYFYL